MKDSYGYLLKLSVVLIVLLLILQTSLEYFSPSQYERFSQFESNVSPANFENAGVGYKYISSTSSEEQDPETEKIIVNIEPEILSNVLGVDFKKMLESNNTAFQQEVVTENVDEEGNYILPDYEYCDPKYWIPKEALRSLAPNCDPDKL
jgi:hypothetical protein